MSVSAGARRDSTDGVRITESLLRNEQDFIQRMKPFNASAPGQGPATSGEMTGSNPLNMGMAALANVGAQIDGALAYLQNNLLKDVDDALKVGRGVVDGVFTSFGNIVNAVNDDVLDILDGGDFDGQLLKVLIPDGIDNFRVDNRNNPGNTTGNIFMSGVDDLTAEGGDVLEFIFDANTTPPSMTREVTGIPGVWRLSSGIGGGSGPPPAPTDRIIDGNTIAQVIDAVPTFVVTLDGVQKFSIQNTRIDLDDLEIFGIEKLWFNTDDGLSQMVTIGASGPQFFDINVLDVNDAINIKFDGDDSARFQDGRFQLFSSAPNTQSASMSMFRDDPSPLPNNALADIDFDGRDQGGNFTTYGSIIGTIEQAIEGAEEGRIAFEVAGGSGTGGSLKRAMRISVEAIEMDDVWVGLSEISLPINPDADKGKIYLRDNGGITTPYFLDTAGTETSLIAPTDRIIDGNTFAIVIDAAPLFSVTLDGVQKFSIQNTRIDLDDTEIFDIEKLWFNTDDGLNPMVTMGAQNASIFAMNVINNFDAIDITFQGDESMRFQNGRFQIFSASPNIFSASMSMFRDDFNPLPTSALGDIDFDGNNDAAAFHEYASIVGAIADPTDGSESGDLSFQVASPNNFGNLLNAMRVGSDRITIFDLPMRFDAISTPSLNQINATQGLIYAKDLGGGTTAPFWLDDNGLESNLIGGGTAGSLTQGISVVKEADEFKVSDTTLAVDAELKFTPTADTLYFIEFDLRYSTGFTDLDVAIQGGADMTYFIVETNIDAIGELWSTTSSSNVEKLTFNLNALNAPTLATGYAIVQVNSDVSTVGLSWAQNTSNVSASFMLTGSMIRIFPQGTTGTTPSAIGKSGGSVVKQVDQSKSSDTTLATDDELFFTPLANTLYFIEWNFKYRTSDSGGISPAMKVAISGGADMTYDISKSTISTINRFYETPLGSSSNGTNILENAVGDISAANGYAIIQINSDVNPVGISWAQDSSNAKLMTMFAGSAIRIIPQGSQAQGGGGGAGSGGEVKNLVISTAGANIGIGNEDTNTDFYGQGNGADFQGIALGSVNPGVPTVTHTVVAADFPTNPGVNGLFSFTRFGFMAGFNVRNGGVGPGVKYVNQIYLNGVAVDIPFTSVGLVLNPGTDGNGARMIQLTSVNVQVGDVLGLAVWEDSASTLTLEHYAFYIYPTKMQSVDSEFHHLLQTNLNGDSSNERGISGKSPNGVGGGVTLVGEGTQTYTYNGDGPRWPVWFSPTNVMFQGATLEMPFQTFGSSTGNGSILNRLEIPFLPYINEMQILT